MIKEATASAFVLRRTERGEVEIALVWHPRMEEWMAAGGHVEAEEHPAEAALREIREETGLVTQLIPAPAVALPAGFPHTAVAAPWWIVEMNAGPDNHTAVPHVHVDNVFLAWAADSTPVQEADHRVRWFTRSRLGEADAVAEDSRLQAKEVLELIASGHVVLPQ
ncbi:NUDIX hydrolase [Planomonospora sphaerica]|uniref:NUDIX hydrolase n=1 Tax=Planomonospora sphaerica TaxID=161355 RepID=A0A171DJ37_9ACTN|nr:NUDIX domain-containing protein [Planomonospora sphaerica]GAT68869.1 NUDIX hydrolase [Planomonospora sphaerica]